MEKLIRFAREYGTRISIAHVSTPEAMELIKCAKAQGQDIYLETSPHYLFLTEDVISPRQQSRTSRPYSAGSVMAALCPLMCAGCVLS